MEFSHNGYWGHIALDFSFDSMLTTLKPAVEASVEAYTADTGAPPVGWRGSVEDTHFPRGPLLRMLRRNRVWADYVAVVPPNHLVDVALGLAAVDPAFLAFVGRNSVESPRLALYDRFLHRPFSKFPATCTACVQVSESKTPELFKFLNTEEESSDTDDNCLVYVSLGFLGNHWYLVLFKSNLILWNETLRLSPAIREEIERAKRDLKGVGRTILCECIRVILSLKVKAWNRRTPIGLSAEPLGLAEKDRTAEELRALPEADIARLMQLHKKKTLPKLVDHLTTRRLSQMYESLGFRRVTNRFGKSVDMEGTLGSVAAACAARGLRGALWEPVAKRTRSRASYK